MLEVASLVFAVLAIGAAVIAARLAWKLGSSDEITTATVISLGRENPLGREARLRIVDERTGSAYESDVFLTPKMRKRVGATLSWYMSHSLAAWKCWGGTTVWADPWYRWWLVVVSGALGVAGLAACGLVQKGRARLALVVLLVGVGTGVCTLMPAVSRERDIAEFLATASPLPTQKAQVH